MPEIITAPSAPRQRALVDLAQLQGAWASISGQRPTELLIAGHLFTVRFLDGALYMGTFEIDPDEAPCAMDMRIDEGPVKHKGLIALCVYELMGDMLRWCPGEPGSDSRPDCFASEEEKQKLCILFRRSPKG